MPGAIAGGQDEGPASEERSDRPSAEQGDPHPNPLPRGRGDRIQEGVARPASMLAQPLSSQPNPTVDTLPRRNHTHVSRIS
jgi:hypothetical protein